MPRCPGASCSRQCPSGRIVNPSHPRPRVARLSRGEFPRLDSDVPHRCPCDLRAALPDGDVGRVRSPRGEFQPALSFRQDPQSESSCRRSGQLSRGEFPSPIATYHIGVRATCAPRCRTEPPGSGRSPRHYFVRSACARLDGAGAVSGQRRDAASPRRQVENCAAGVPIGGGALSTLAVESPVQARDPRQARGSPEPEPPS
jgi:hypothetical protein